MTELVSWIFDELVWKLDGSDGQRWLQWNYGFLESALEVWRVIG